MNTKNILENLQNNALIKQTPSNSALSTLLDLHNQTSEYIKQAKSSNTWKAYKADWQDFLSWCNERQQLSLPASPATVAMYLSDRANTHKTSSLQRRIASIAQMHIGNKLDDPTKSPEVKECWRGIRRTKGIAQTQKSPILVDHLKNILQLIPNTLLGKRDKALLLVGFTSAFRRSEIVALNYEDLEFSREGVIINLRKSKTDQMGEGRKVGLPYSRDSKQCPVIALKKWLELAAIKEGAIFRGVNRHSQVLPGRLTDRQVANTVKKYCEIIGLDSTLFSGHSLRSGLATSAAIAGASERQIMAQTGHKNSAMVRRYIRDAEVFRDNVVSKIGL
jgi:integrase